MIKRVVHQVPPNYAQAKNMLYNSGDQRCAYCGKEFGSASEAVREHIIPLCRGGSDDEGNLLLVCPECNCKKAATALGEYLLSAQTDNKAYYKSFLDELCSIRELLKLEPSSPGAERTFYHLLFVQVVVCMETYLSDALVNSVKGNDQRIRQALEEISDFSKQTIRISDAYLTVEHSEQLVMEYLSGVLYHNLAKVEQLYRAILGVHFKSDKGDVYKIVQRRHDLVHRNGLEWDSATHLALERSDVDLCINSIRDFISVIETQLQVLNRTELPEATKQKMLSALQSEM